MNKNTGIVIGVIALVVIVGGVYASMKSEDKTMMVKEQMEQKAMEDKAMMEKKAMEEKEAMMKADTTNTETMMKKDETSMMDKGDTMMKVGAYEAYSPEKVMLASATHDVVLFFRASWCPTCIAVDKDIKANLSKIPGGLTILDVNYDSSSELKKKYGVTYQHTFVQVDKDGTLIKKWSGSPTLTAIVAEVK